MKKALSLLLILCLSLTLGTGAFASGEPSGEGGGGTPSIELPAGTVADGSALVLLNGKENKSEAYGMDTFYAETLTYEALAAVEANCILVYTEDAAGALADLEPSVHGEYQASVNGNTVSFVPMDEVIVLGPGKYEKDYDGTGRNLLLVLQSGAELTGTLTNISLCMQEGAVWTLTGESTLIGLDACRNILRYSVYGNGNIGWYNSEVYLSDDMREWTEQLADTIGSWTSYNADATALTFEDYYTAIMAGDPDAVLDMDNVFLSIFPVNMGELVTASVYNGENDGADCADESGVIAVEDAYADLRQGHGYAGGDVAYTSTIVTDPVALGQQNRSSIYATTGTYEYTNIFIDQKSYSGSIVYADGTNRSQDAMMKYGVNSAVWANGADAVISLKDFYTIGANDGFYATYGGIILAENGVLEVTANHGFQICYDGTVIARNMDVITTGMMGSALSSDHGGGFMFCDNVFAYAAYESTGAAGIYCDGYCNFWIQNSTVGSKSDHSVVMCGGGTLNLIDTNLFSQSESGAGVYIHPMGNNPGQVTTLNMTDVTFDVPGRGIWTFGKSTDITLSGDIDATGIDSGVLLYARQMDGGNDFMGGKTLDMAYDIPENITNLTMDGATVNGAVDIVYAEEDTASGNFATINVALTNGSTYTGAVQADSMTIDEASVWTVSGESTIGQLNCTGTIVGTATQQADGSWLVIPAEAETEAEAAAMPDGDGTENQNNVLDGNAQPASAEEYDAYVAYLTEFMTAYAGDGDGTGGFDESAKANAINDLNSYSFGADVNAFPFEMFVSQFGAADFAAWQAQQ